MYVHVRVGDAPLHAFMRACMPLRLRLRITCPWSSSSGSSRFRSRTSSMLPSLPKFSSSSPVIPMHNPNKICHIRRYCANFSTSTCHAVQTKVHRTQHTAWSGRKKNERDAKKSPPRTWDSRSSSEPPDGATVTMHSRASNTNSVWDAHERFSCIPARHHRPQPARIFFVWQAPAKGKRLAPDSFHTRGRNCFRMAKQFNHPELPEELRAPAPDLIMRPLEVTDLDKGFIPLLGQVSCSLLAGDLFYDAC